MEAYKYVGRVHAITPLQTFQSGFAKRTLVLQADGESKYPEYAAFEFTRSKDGNRDGIKKLDGIRIGQRVQVEFYTSAFESRKTPGSWFVSNRAVRVDVRADDGQSDLLSAKVPDAPEPPDGIDGDGAGDNMPF